MMSGILVTNIPLQPIERITNVKTVKEFGDRQ